VSEIQAAHPEDDSEEFQQDIEYQDFEDFEEQAQCPICKQYDCVCDISWRICPLCGSLDCTDGKYCGGEDPLEGESDSLRDMYLMREEDEQREREGAFYPFGRWP